MLLTVALREWSHPLTETTPKLLRAAALTTGLLSVVVALTSCGSITTPSESASPSRAAADSRPTCYPNCSGANLQSQTLSGDLQGIKLAGADLRGATIAADANLTGVDMAGADLRGVTAARADMKGVGLSGANARKADFSGADLRLANLTNANLGFADFSDADLGNANLRGANTGGASMDTAKYNNTICPDGSKTPKTTGPGGLPSTPC